MNTDFAAASDVPLHAALKYNPHLWGADELRAIFAVRQAELQDLVGALIRARPDQVGRHALITGHRGMGKTTLLRRLALSIADTPDIAKRWLALTFPEEQYTVRTLAEFWVNVLDALADALGREGAASAELVALDAHIDRLGALPAAKREKAALELLTDWIDQHQRGLVLLIDSSDQLLTSLSAAEADASTTALLRLRHTLAQQPGLVWIGASYESLEGPDLYQDAFHDFFVLYELQPLSLNEMRAALLALAQRFGAGKEARGMGAEHEMARILDARPERLRALRVLTGGNPRATVMLYELFAAGGADNGQADLKVLLDLMTPLYKARIEALSDLPRKLFAHLMEHWHPMGLRELSEASGFPSSTLSAQLARLEIAGLVEKTQLTDPRKRSGYQAAERLFNVWYLMRSGSRRVRQRLAWLVEFMRMWYSQDELNRMVDQRSQRHGRGELADSESLEYSRAVAAAAGEKGLGLEWGVLSAVYRESSRTSQAIARLMPGLLEADGSHAEFTSATHYLERFAALDAKLIRCPHAQGSAQAQWVALVKGSLALSLRRKERIADDALTLTFVQYQGMVDVLTGETSEWLLQFGLTAAEALYAAVRRGDFFPDCPDAKLAYAQLDHCFAHDARSYQAALELFGTRQQNHWVESAYRRAIELDQNCAVPWNGLANLLKNHLKRFDEAESAYRRAIALDETFADPWNGLGNLLKNNLKRFDEAESAYRHAIALDVQSAYPWNGLGNLLQDHLNRFDEAESAYRRAIELDPTLAFPWQGLGDLLKNHLKRFDEAESAYRRAIELDETSANPWNSLGNLLKSHLKRFDEAESAYRHAIALDQGNVYSWASLARFQVAGGKRDEATASYRTALERLAPGEGLSVRLQAHLWLGNRDLAAQALDALTKTASEGDVNAFFRLRKQCWECHSIGLGQPLAQMMEASSWGAFLLPFSLALRAATSGDAPSGAAPEVLILADEVLLELRTSAT